MDTDIKKPRNQWFIAIKHRAGDIYNFIDTPYMRLIAPDGHYYADPFLAEHEGKTYLFFEDYDYDKGRLAVMEITTWSHGGDDFASPTPLGHTKQMLDMDGTDCHMSFPSVVKCGTEWYMVPEQVLSGQLWLYKAKEFPHTWIKWGLVAYGRFDDPILRAAENGYEIHAAHDGDKIRVWHAPNLDQAWSLVDAVDQQYARPAGNFIPDLGLQPYQDSVPTYGAAIVIRNEKGAVVKRINPDWFPNLTGTHTFNVSDKYVVIDGRIRLND